MLKRESFRRASLHRLSLRVDRVRRPAPEARQPVSTSQVGFLSVTALLLLLLATGCGSVLPSFNPVTQQGLAVTDLFTLVTILSVAVFLLVAGVLVYCMVRFRDRGGAEEPPQVEGNRTLEITWTGGSIALVLLLLALGTHTMLDVDQVPPSSMTVQVIGHQWWWQYVYPGQNVVTANELHVPVNTPVNLQLSSDDVIHSFWVPQFGWKQDLVPGHANYLVATVTSTGTFDGTCTQFCGDEHAWMRIRVVSQSTDQFNTWLQQQQAPAAAPTDPTAQRGQQVFLTNSCVNCHTISGTSANGQVGPDLSHLGSRSIIGSGVLDNTPDNLTQWIRNAQSVKPGVLMPAFDNISDADLSALATYLEGLK